MKKIYTTLVTCLLLATTAMAQPANDDCAGAISLTPDTICNTIMGDITDGTESLAAIVCNSFEGSADADVWYSFVAADTAQDVHVTGGADFDAVVELFDGTCGALNSLDCADATLENGEETISSTDLTIGSTYFVRVYHWYDTIPDDPTFTICVQTPPPPPVNNNQSPNFEGFEDGLPPPCWTNLDEDGDGNAWFGYAADPYMGDSSAASASWLAGVVLNPDNYLIMPQVTPGMDEDLTYWVAAQDPAYAMENYSVVLSTTGMAAADFTVELFTEVLADDVWAFREIDLSAYMGMDIYLAFRHHNVSDMFYMKIDEVQFPTLTEPCTVGINESDVNYNVSIFPNPSSNHFNFISNEEMIQSIDVVDLAGRVVRTEMVNANQYQLHREDLSNGIYFVNMHFEAGSMTRKLILE